MKHLTPTERVGEIVMSLFGFVWGAGVIFDLSSGSNPLYWADIDEVLAKHVSLLLIFSSLLHAVGIRANGSWFISPLLRLLPLLVYSFTFSYLSFVGAGATARWTYGFISILFILGSLNSASDCLKNLYQVGFRRNGSDN